MSDKVTVLLIDDETDYIGNPFIEPEEINLVSIQSWEEAQEVLKQGGDSSDADIILIDINFEKDISAPKWRQSVGGPPYDSKKPTGLLIGLALSGSRFHRDLPQIAIVYTADPSLFRDDPAARTTAALLDAAVNRPPEPWSTATIERWFDSLSLGSDPHATCCEALKRFRETLEDWCKDGASSRLVAAPGSHWRAEIALQRLLDGGALSQLRGELVLEFVTASDRRRRFNLCSLFSDTGLAQASEHVKMFLQRVGHFPRLLRDCEAYANQVALGNPLTVVPPYKILERAVVIMIRLVDWWREKQERWKEDVQEGWNLKESRPDPTCDMGLEDHLVVLANLLMEVEGWVGSGFDISKPDDITSEIRDFVKEGDRLESTPIFGVSSLRHLLPMLIDAGVLVRSEDGLWSVPNRDTIRMRLRQWEPIVPTNELREQDFLPKVSMTDHNQFKRALRDVNDEYGLNLPDQWNGAWRGDGSFKLPWFLRVILQEYARERLGWDNDSEWPTWLLRMTILR